MKRLVPAVGLALRANRRRAAAALAGVCLLWGGAGPLGAQSVRIDPDSGVPGEGFVDYSGHFGEVLKLRGGWKTEGSIEDGREVIRHYPSSRISFSDSPGAFNPDASLFVAENFTAYALIQLVIQPRPNSGAFDLAGFRRSRVDQYLSSGAQIRVIERPAYGGLTGAWPAGTFEIQVDAPYSLSELYVVTPEYVCVLTSGRDTPPSTVIRRHSDWMRSSLRDWIAATAPSPEPVPARETEPATTLAEEVLRQLKTTKEYVELKSIYDQRSGGDPYWLRSGEGQATAEELKMMEDDAAATRIVTDGARRALQYSVQGRPITDTGILVADLETDKKYREFIAQAIAAAICSDRDVQGLLERVRGSAAPGGEPRPGAARGLSGQLPAPRGQEALSQLRAEAAQYGRGN